MRCEVFKSTRRVETGTNIVLGLLPASTHALLERWKLPNDEFEKIKLFLIDSKLFPVNKILIIINPSWLNVDKAIVF